jgi:large subunit ribosomal protein L34e
MMQKSVRTPGNRNVLHKVSRKTSQSICSSCGSLLHGVKRMDTVGMGRAPTTQKRVSRKFGGSMCISCSRETLRQKARNI